MHRATLLRVWPPTAEGLTNTKLNMVGLWESTRLFMKAAMSQACQAIKVQAAFIVGYKQL